MFRDERYRAPHHRFPIRRCGLRNKNITLTDTFQVIDAVYDPYRACGYTFADSLADGQHRPFA